jgi:hypothetical protein
MLYATEQALAETARGSDNPTLSFNLSEAKDYDSGMQFLDLMKMMRPWIGHEAGQWGGMSIDDLRAGDYLDADGWVKSIPDGVEKVGTLWQWKGMDAQAEDHKGVYVLKYEGTGTLQLSGDAKIISSEPGQITFENKTGGNFYLDLSSTDPEGTGDYIRDISIVAEKNMDLYEAGGTFNPEWLSLISDARELRFMDWMETNNSDVVTWDDRPSADGPNTGLGVSVEDMVKLANELGVDPWFTMPHMANEDYIRNFATYVKEHLDPALKVRVEYSNETWNFAFQQTQWLNEQSKAEWGVEAHVDYHAKKAVETALIWEDVYGGDADGRLINVLGTQAGNPWILGRLMDPKVWQEHEPDSYIDPALVFEEAAVTTYFGSPTVSNQELRDDLLAQIKASPANAAAYLAEKLMDPDYKGSIPYTKLLLEGNAAIADQYGLKMVAYEGGQHVHQSFAVKGLTEADKDILTSFMTDFVRSEEMGELYQELWGVWADVGDGSFMQFGDVGAPSKWGSWSLYNGLEDETPRSRVLEELSADSTLWWDAEGGVQYQQGITAYGTADADLMVGTVQEDFLLGGDGDDIFVAGGGNDGINGGNGIDRLILSGTAADYTLHVEGKGYRLIGPDGSDFLVNVEEISFDNDKIVTLSDLARNPDGSIDLAALDLPPALDLAAPTVIVEAPSDAVEAPSDPVVVAASSAPTGTRGVPVVDVTPTDGTTSPTTSIGTTIVQAVTNVQDQITTASRPAAQIDSDGIMMLLGSAGNDRLAGLSANDVLRGAAGDDILEGNGGNDRLVGGNGDDSLFGGGGDDVLNGGHGNDLLTGGQGKDRFVFTHGDGADRVQDFARDDTLWLKGYLDPGQKLEDAASDVRGGLLISNGDDRIFLLGLDTDDLSWMNVQIVA